MSLGLLLMGSVTAPFFSCSPDRCRRFCSLVECDSQPFSANASLPHSLPCSRLERQPVYFFFSSFCSSVCLGCLVAWACVVRCTQHTHVYSLCTFFSCSSACTALSDAVVLSLRLLCPLFPSHLLSRPALPSLSRVGGSARAGMCSTVAPRSSRFPSTPSSLFFPRTTPNSPPWEEHSTEKGKR